MSAFEFFFGFYGLILGLSVAELVGGFARLLHEKVRVRFGLLMPLQAVFMAADIATFWNRAWAICRFAPFNMALLARWRSAQSQPTLRLILPPSAVNATSLS